MVLAPVALLCVYLGGAYFAGLVFLAFVRCLYEWVRMAKKMANKWKVILLGYLYFLVCFGLFLQIRYQTDGFSLIFLLFIIVWSSDIGAYFAGKYFGKTKCVPKISPNKTWAGVWGGVLCAVAFANLYTYYVLPERFEPIALCFVSVIIAFASMLGDLVISYVKRLADVKDTGSIIPGHGGVLDRIDSLILATPLMGYFLYWGLI